MAMVLPPAAVLWHAASKSSPAVDDKHTLSKK
jgi:hypothetical protein